MLEGRKEEEGDDSTVGMMNGSATPYVKVCPQVCSILVVTIKHVRCDNIAYLAG